MKKIKSPEGFYIVSLLILGVIIGIVGFDLLSNTYSPTNILESLTIIGAGILMFVLLGTKLWHKLLNPHLEGSDLLSGGDAIIGLALIIKGGYDLITGTSLNVFINAGYIMLLISLYLLFRFIAILYKKVF